MTSDINQFPPSSYRIDGIYNWGPELIHNDRLKHVRHTRHDWRYICHGEKVAAQGGPNTWNTYIFIYLRIIKTLHYVFPYL